MDKLKFRYSVVKGSSFYVERIFTITEIENGCVLKWITANYIDPAFIKKDRFIKSINDNDLFENDIVELPIMRLSGSYSSWYQRTNKNHKEYHLNFLIYFDKDDLQFKLKIANPLEEKKLKQPIDREKIEQNLSYPTSFDKWQFSNHDFTSIKKVGNRWKNPELLSKENK